MDSNEALLTEDPGNPVFREVATSLRKEGRHARALSICLKGLSHNGDYSPGRLELARIFFEMDCIPFAAREVKELAIRHPENTFLISLLEKLEPNAQVDTSATEEGAEEVFAEAEFDFEALDLLEEEEQE